MVNRALTRRTYGRTPPGAAVLDAASCPCPMPAAERIVHSSPARADASRSPFVRLRELLGTVEPGQPAISLAVGEPQHAVPSFVGPVVAAHIGEFGRYPMNKGLDEFCQAAAGW